MTRSTRIPRPIHPFPARMAAGIPWGILRREGRPNLRILDPMIGSGTTAVVARSLGHRAAGYDTDPLAVLISNVWAANTEEEQVREAVQRVWTDARRFMAYFGVLDAYPEGADEETKAFVSLWFDDTNRRELAALARAIGLEQSRTVRALLWCAFSRLIISKQASVSRALDLSHSRPHIAKRPSAVRPIGVFQASVNHVLRLVPFKDPSRCLPPATIRTGDARGLPLGSECVDVVITSPPYLNGIDYMRGHKFSLVWLGHNLNELRGLRAGNVGTEVSAGGQPDDPGVAEVLGVMGDLSASSPRQLRMLARYVRDMDRVMGEIARVLVPGGELWLVIGDSTQGGTYIRNSRALSYLCRRHGLNLERRRRRQIAPNRRYLPPPTSEAAGPSLQARLRAEVVLHARKLG